MRRTNAIRLLERAGVPFALHKYRVQDGELDALSVARLIGAEPGRLFKTLVTRSDAGTIAVFCVPGDHQLDQKAAARLTGAKKVALVPRPSLQGVTGYIPGGCSPIGMKKAFPTWIDESARDRESIFVSAGVRGVQIEMSPEALIELIEASFAPVAT